MIRWKNECNTLRCVWVFLAWSGLTGGAPLFADAALEIDPPMVEVTTGETFTVQIHLDLDTATAGRQMPDDGLFSMALRISYPESLLDVADTSAVTIPPELQSDGLGGPPTINLGAGVVDVVGVLPLGVTAGYTNSLLLSVEFSTDTNAGPAQISADLLFDPPQANLIDTLGTVLDNQLTGLPVTADVTITRPFVPLLITEMTWLPSGSIRLQATGPEGLSLTVQRKPHLAAPLWQDLGASPVAEISPGVYRVNFQPGSWRMFRIMEQPSSP